MYRFELKETLIDEVSSYIHVGFNISEFSPVGSLIATWNRVVENGNTDPQVRKVC